MEAPNIDAARRAAGLQARSLQAAALDGEQFENDLIAGGLSLDKAAMTAVWRAVDQLDAASAGWDRVTAELSKHAQGEEYAASGHAASTGFLGGGGPAAAERAASPSAAAPGAPGPGTTGDTTTGECPSWCQGQHYAGSTSHSGKAVEVGGEQEGSWAAQLYLTTQDLAYRSPEDGTAKVGIEFSDGDGRGVEVSTSLAGARKISQALAGLAKAGHLGGDTTTGECPSWCQGQHYAGSTSHSGEAVEVGGEQEGSWSALVYLTTEDLAYRSPEDGTAKVGIEFSDGDGRGVEVSTSLAGARKISQALAGLAKAGHLG